MRDEVKLEGRKQKAAKAKALRLVCLLLSAFSSFIPPPSSLIPAFLSAEDCAAVDVEDFARDVSRPVGGEEDDGERHVVSRRKASERNALNDAFLISLVAEDLCIHPRVNPTGRDRVDTDVRREFDGERFRETDLASFRGSVI